MREHCSFRPDNSINTDQSLACFCACLQARNLKYDKFSSKKHRWIGRRASLKNYLYCARHVLRLAHDRLC
jgi:hypothetical protein